MDMRKMRRLLRETTRLAERASMTGSLQGGGRIAIRQYNAIRNHLQDNGVIPDDLFQELDEDEATFDELGVVTGMLESYLEDEDEVGDEETCGEGDESRRGRRAKRHGRWNWQVFANPDAWKFWSDPQTMRDLQQVGEELREHMPEILEWRDRMRSQPPVPPTPPTPPAPPTPPHSPMPPRHAEARAGHPAPDIKGAGSGPDNGASRDSSPDVTIRLRQISEELRAEDLDYSRRMELTRELSELLR